MDLHYITQIQTAMKNCIKFLNKIDVAPVTCVLNFKCTSLTHLYFFVALDLWILELDALAVIGKQLQVHQSLKPLDHCEGWLTVSLLSGDTSIIPRSKFWHSGGTKCGIWKTPRLTWTKCGIWRTPRLTWTKCGKWNTPRLTWTKCGIWKTQSLT